MAAKPKIIFDTNVCGKLLLPPYLQQLAEIQSRLARRFAVYASPNTFMELLDAIKGGSGEHFEADKARLRIMAGGGQVRFLSFPITSALKRVLGLKVPLTKLGPDELKEAFRIVLRAKTRDDLLAGDVRKSGSGRRRHGIDPDLIASPMLWGEMQHVASLDKLKQGTHLFPPPDQWAADMACDVGCALTPQQAKILANSLDAAYTYDAELHRLIKGGYNAQKNANDWIDSMQLLYLCDPELYVLTDDKRLRKRCNTSQQSRRIVLLEELPALLELTV